MDTKLVAPRPKTTRDAEASRARILDQARREFVRYGLNGARVDRIAEAAGVNKNLIYHYYSSKELLYLEVLERIYVDLRASQDDSRLRALPPVDGMRELVATTFDHFIATPDLIRLMSVENIHYAQHLKNSTRVKPLYRGLLNTLQILLENGQRTKVFRSNVDAIDLYLSISGLAYFFLSNQHTLSWLLDRNFVSKQRIAQRRAHVVEMVMSYLAAGAPDELTQSKRKPRLAERRQ
jgi:TetR/AcrR family transcriptional regulator